MKSKQKSRSYTLHKPPVQKSKPVAQPDDEDDIPLHREIGQQVAFPYADEMRVGEVIAVKDPLTCLIESRDDLFVERGQEMLALGDHWLCPHCGGFCI